MIGFMPPVASLTGPHAGPDGYVGQHRDGAITPPLRIRLTEYTGKHRRPEYIEVTTDRTTPVGFCPAA